MKPTTATCSFAARSYRSYNKSAQSEDNKFDKSKYPFTWFKNLDILAPVEEDDGNEEEEEGSSGLSDIQVHPKSPIPEDPHKEVDLMSGRLELVDDHQD